MKNVEKAEKKASSTMERFAPEKIDRLTVYDKSPSFMKGFFLKNMRMKGSKFVKNGKSQCFFPYIFPSVFYVMK
jgi:hypothetical protein